MTQHDDNLKSIRAVLNQSRDRLRYFKHYGGGPFGSKGIPDLLGIRTVRVDKLVEAGIEMVGIGFGVEVKRDEKDKPTKEQAAVLDIINYHGGVGLVAWEPEQVIERLGLKGAILPLFTKNERRQG